jgi:hypothetical protein
VCIYKYLNIRTKVVELVPKNEVDIFFEYFDFFSAASGLPELEPTQKGSSRGPLSFGMPSCPEGSKMEKTKKISKLENRHLIKNPFII